MTLPLIEFNKIFAIVSSHECSASALYVASCLLDYIFKKTFSSPFFGCLIVNVYIIFLQLAPTTEKIVRIFPIALRDVYQFDLFNIHVYNLLLYLRDKMTQAFEFALDKVGLDFNSYQVFLNLLHVIYLGNTR